MKNMASSNLGKISSLLANHNFDKVLSELQDPGNIEFIRKSTLDIIPEIGSVLIGDDSQTDPKAIDFCLEAFKVLALVGNAKELLMGFLEQLECLPQDVRFHVLLYPLQAVLLRLPNKRGQSLEWVFSSVCGFVKELQVPKSFNLEGKERLLLDYDSDVVRIQNTIESIIDFCRPFIKEVSLCVSTQCHDDRSNRQRRILSYFILKLFDAPLAMVDLSYQHSHAKGRLRNVAEILVASMCELEPNFYRLYTYKLRAEKNEHGNDKPISNLALATFSYLIHAEQVCKFCLPCVYSHTYTLELNLPLIIYLLKQSQDCVIQKGLLLMDYLLHYLPVHHLGKAALATDHYGILAQCLIDIMIFCKISEFRKLGLTIFVKYIEKFNDASRHQILVKLLSSNKHAGIQGLLIQIFKTNVVAALQQNPPAQCFVGRNLENMLRLILVLPNGVETDLLEDCERILEVLNFVRFLLIRDNQKENVTGIWKMIDFLEISFVKPLQTGLDLSKAHFELELKHERESKASSNEGERLPLSVTVDGNALPCMPQDHKLDILQNSILGLELIQSVLSIVNDVIAYKKNNVEN